MLRGIHHVAIICSNLERSLAFYAGILGMEVMARHFRPDRNSWKVDLSLNGNYCLELFTFEGAPPRVSGPEALGLRHLAFAVNDLEAMLRNLSEKGIISEPVRTDPYTAERFCFIRDPDNLPVELVERLSIITPTDNTSR